MSKILLDYFFPITAIEPTPQASTAFLRQICLVVKPKMSVPTGVVTVATSMAAVIALTDNTEAQQLFNAGMSKVYILPMDELGMANALAAHLSYFYTLAISSDFTDADVIMTAASGNATITSYANLVATTPDTIQVGVTVFTAQAGAATLGTATFQAATSNNATAASLAAQINAHAVAGAKVHAVAVGAVVTITALADGESGNSIALIYVDNASSAGATVSGATLTGGDGLDLGAFKGVVGISSTDDDFLEDQAAIANRVAFHTKSGNGAKNMLYAFGKLLSNALAFRNQQYITMPFADDIDQLGEATNLFDSKISFVLSDDQYGQRLGLFAVGGKAIVAPYILKNLQIDLQSAALSYVSGNQPGYTKTEASLIEDELQKVVQLYIGRRDIEAGTVEVKLEQDNFVASGYINVSEPKALWRIVGEMRQTL